MTTVFFSSLKRSSFTESAAGGDGANKSVRKECEIQRGDTKCSVWESVEEVDNGRSIFEVFFSFSLTQSSRWPALKTEKERERDWLGYHSNGQEQQWTVCQWQVHPPVTATTTTPAVKSDLLLLPSLKLSVEDTRVTCWLLLLLLLLLLHSRLLLSRLKTEDAEAALLALLPGRLLSAETTTAAACVFTRHSFYIVNPISSKCSLLFGPKVKQKQCSTKAAGTRALWSQIKCCSLRHRHFKSERLRFGAFWFAEILLKNYVNSKLPMQSYGFTKMPFKCYKYDKNFAFYPMKSISDSNLILPHQMSIQQLKKKNLLWKPFC